jgi:hypothetical protein
MLLLFSSPIQHLVASRGLVTFLSITFETKQSVAYTFNQEIHCVLIHFKYVPAVRLRAPLHSSVIINVSFYLKSLISFEIVDTVLSVGSIIKELFEYRIRDYYIASILRTSLKNGSFAVLLDRVQDEVLPAIFTELMPTA